MPSSLRSKIHAGAGESLLRERRRHRLDPFGNDAMVGDYNKSAFGRAVRLSRTYQPAGSLVQVHDLRRREAIEVVLLAAE